MLFLFVFPCIHYLKYKKNFTKTRNIIYIFKCLFLIWLMVPDENGENFAFCDLLSKYLSNNSDIDSCEGMCLPSWTCVISFFIF